MNDLLNDPTDERLDERLRTMMRTAVAEPPAPPSVADLDTLVSVGPEPRREWFRPLTAVAAAVAVLAVGALVLWPSADDDVDPADSTVPEVVAGQFLDAYYLPSELPAGWQIVEGRRDPAQEAYTGNSAVFTRRDDPTLRGVASFAPGPDASPATSAAQVEGETPSTLPIDVSSARWDPDRASLSWIADGREAFVATTNRTESEARQLAEALVVVPTLTGPTFEAAEGMPWVKVKDYQLDGTAVPWSGVNSLTIGRDEFTSMTIAVQRSAGPTIPEWGLPTEITGVYMAEEPDGHLTLSRSVGELTLEAYMASPSPEVRSLAASILGNIEEVSLSQWEAALPDITAVLSETPVDATFDLIQHVVTLRRGGPFSGICVERNDGAKGCARFSIDATSQLPLGFATNIVLDDGSWVAVGAIESTAEMCDVASTSDANAATAVNGEQQIVLFVPGPETRDGFNCTLGGESEFGFFFVSELRTGS